MQRIIKLLGYGAGEVPMNTGVEMGTARDMGYADDIVDAMARKHPGQWFSYSVETPAGKALAPVTRYKKESV